MLFSFKNFRILFIFVFLYFFVLRPGFCELKDGQGNYLSDLTIKKIEYGMEKSALMELLGEPTFIFSKNIDCWCYYYLKDFNKKKSKVIRRYVVLYFDGDFLKKIIVSY